MYSPYKFASRIGNIGAPLPDPYNTLALHGIHFRRGATSMLAGAPGSFKSVFALNLLANWSRSGVGALYFSADSDEFTVCKRLSGILTGDNLEAVERRILKGERTAYQSALRTLEGAEFEYKQMDMHGIALHVKSYEAIYGAYPDVVFVDNLIDFVDAPDDWGGMLIMTRELDALAKEIRAHICILHHARLRQANGKDSIDLGRPPADWEIQGRVTQIPRLVLTLAASGLTIRLACVKNTNGRQYRDALVWTDWQVLSSMRVEDINFRMGAV